MNENVREVMEPNALPEAALFACGSFEFVIH